MSDASKVAAVCTYDFTLGDNFAAEEEIKAWLSEHCKKWCFQLECGETSGYVHFQGRFTLGTRLRPVTLKKKMPWQQIHLSVTSNENRDNFYYVTKDETRVDGPWKDTDRVYFTPDHLQIKDFLPFQKSIIEIISGKPGREVNLLYDPTGGQGKSTLIGYLECNYLAVNVPFCNDYRDIMRMVMNQEKLGCYFIDMPRAISKDKVRQIFGGIESIKDGYAYDDRYKFKKERFQQPHVFVIMNVLPDMSMLSADRWVLWTIKNKELVKYEIPKVEFAPPILNKWEPTHEIKIEKTIDDALYGTPIGQENIPVSCEQITEILNKQIETHVKFLTGPT